MGEMNMKRKMVVSLIVAVAAISAQAVVTNTVQFGANGDIDWDNNVVTNTVASPDEYSVSYGVPLQYSLSGISNLLFTVTFTETNDIPVRIRQNWLSAGYTNEANDRLTSNEVLQVTVSYSDPDNKLMNLKVAGFGTYWNTAPYETTVFSDGANSTSITASANDTIFDYDTTGLDPLTTANTNTWNLLVSVNDDLGGGTNFTDSALGAFVLEYIADVEYIPDLPVYTNLTPVFYDFVDGGEFDNQGLGVTMTRSNSWGTAITITTVEIIGQDGSSATNVGNKTNIQSVNALGINSVNNGPYGNEPRDFNPNEAWVITFDKDVYMTRIDLASQAADSEMTISSPAFSDIVLLGEGDGNTDGTWDLSDTYVPAGTNVMFQMTSTTNALDWSLRIDDLTVQSVLDVNSYDEWVQVEGLINGWNNAYGDDPDKDSMDNLAEYAFGGDPLDPDAAVYLPVYGLAEAGDTLNYIYRRRMDYDDQGLTYTVGAGTDLMVDPLTNVTTEAGSVAIDDTYESVTNEVSTAAEDQQFMQLEISVD